MGMMNNKQYKAAHEIQNLLVKTFYASSIRSEVRKRIAPLINKIRNLVYRRQN